jgi:hypothetical protein
MAVSFVTQANANTASTFVTTKTITIPSTVQGGDMLFLVAQCYSNSSGSATINISSTGSAWTRQGSSTFVSGTNAQNNASLFFLQAAGTVGSASSDASKVVTITTSVSLLYNLTMVVYRGASATFDGVNITSSTTLTTSCTAPTITTAITGTWLLCLGAICNGASGYSSCTGPSLASTVREANFGSSSGIAVASDSNAAVTAGSQVPGHFTPSTTGDYITWSVGLAPAGGTTHSGTATLTGDGSMTAAGVFAGAAALDGEGSMTATGLFGFPGVATLDGEGNMFAAGFAGYGVLMAGIGTMRAIKPPGPAHLAGIGTMHLVGPPIANLAGIGTMTPNIGLKLFIGLSGIGSFSVPQASGGLVNGIGGVGFPYALPGSTMIAVAPPGSSNWQYLETLGQKTALKYSFACPGGCDKMTATLMVPASYRTQLFNPGWQVRLTRGGHQVWKGKLDEPQATPSGWNLTAVGDGNRGQDFTAVYTSTWPASEPDQPLNNAIGRGMPWVNPGIGTPSGAWFGQAVDSAAQTITALLNLICTRGGLTWYVNSQPGGLIGSSLAVFALPTAVNRLLVVTTPVSRTLGGDINTIFIRYMSSADNTTTGAPAVYATTSVQNAASVAAHQVIETYIDLSDVGVQSQAAAQAVGNSILSVYQRASFAGPFQASYGQLLNTGGVPIDPGTDQAGTVVKLILTDFGYGGEVTPNQPITFIVGAYEWDDFAQTATITPYQNLDQSLSGLLSARNTVMVPIQAASGP